MKFRSNKQAVLPGMEQALCACGCGEWFMRTKRGRTRLYINETHKKRVMRAKRKERASESVVALTPKGWLYVTAKDDDTLNKLWAELTDDERMVIAAMCRAPMTAEKFVYVLLSLFTTTETFRKVSAMEWLAMVRDDISG